MHFVTLTSDWKNDDFYTAAIKGSLLSSCENTEVVTISNRIKPHGIAEAAFVVRNSFQHFPEGTVHMVTVGSGSAAQNKMLAAKIDGHYFLVADNGFLGLLGDATTSEVVSITPSDIEGPTTFPSLTILCRAACRILSGEPLSKIGTPANDYKVQIPLRATLENNTITGTVIYLDSFGNAITNISRDLFERIGKGRSFEIFVQSKHYKITRLNRYYAETGAGDLLALFNSVNLIEIAIRNGSAKDLLNLNTDSTIRIEFKE